MSALLGNETVTGSAVTTATGTSLSMATALGNETVAIGSNVIVSGVPALEIALGTASATAIAFVTVNVTSPAMQMGLGSVFVAKPARCAKHQRPEPPRFR